MNSYFVGRRTEQAQLQQYLQASKAGGGHIVSIAGEIGIGKTRLLSEFARTAEQQGSKIFWGQMIEDPVAPPYLAWLLVLRAYLQQTELDDVRDDVADGAQHISTILPELNQALGVTSRPATGSEEDATRYKLYDAVTRMLLASAERQPQVLLFDNIHLADHSSMQLLEYVARQISTSASLIILAHRTGDDSASSSFRQSSNKLARIAGWQQMNLSGLDEAEVGELLRSVLDSVPASLVEAVHERGDGNPLFTCQVAANLRQLGEISSALAIGSPFEIPDSLDAVITARLSAINDDELEILRIAAVLGRDFDGVLLAQLCADLTNRVLIALDNAVDAGILGALEPGHYRFVHALFRELLYGQIPAGKRPQLHRAAAECIEDRFATALEMPVSELAFHWFEASRGGYEPKAIVRCREAADAANAKHAFGEAATELERALAVASMANPQEPLLQLSLLEALGDAQYSAGQQGLASQTWFKAVQLAKHLNQSERLAEAVLKWQFVRSHTGIAHEAAIEIHEATLNALPDISEALRVRLAASLAVALMHDEQHEVARRLLVASTDKARQLGDSAVLFECLIKAFYVVNRAYESDLRYEMLTEAEQIAIASRGEEDQILAYTAVMFPLAHQGRFREVRERIGELDDRATAAGHGFWRQVAAGFRVSLAILDGNWAQAMQQAQESFWLGNHAGATGVAGRFGFQMFAIHRALGRLDGVAPLFRQVVDSTDGARTWMPGRILLHSELGQAQEAVAALEAYGDLRELVADDMLETNLAFLSDACVQLGDRARCSVLFELLKPYRGYCLNLVATLVHGAASAYLAKLAEVLGRIALARQLYEDALEETERIASPPLMADVRANFGRLLQRSELHEDRARARKLLEQARTVAVDLQMRSLLKRVDTILAASPAATNLTDRELDVLRLVSKGDSNKAVADALQISTATVATHLRHILNKTATHNRTEAVAFARSCGLLGDD